MNYYVFATFLIDSEIQTQRAVNIDDMFPQIWLKRKCLFALRTFQ